MVRKDSKTKKAEQANLQLSKTFKIKRIGRENNSGALPERYRVRGGGPHGLRSKPLGNPCPTSFGESCIYDGTNQIISKIGQKMYI